MNRYRRILEYVSTHPWAVQLETLDAIVEILRLRTEGGRLEDAEIMTRVAAARGRQGDRANAGAIGVIPIYGVIMPRANLMTEMSGGTTVEGIRGAFRSALRDEEVTRIVFDVDSPGGSVEGIPELAAEIRDARGIKPMTAIANYTMASAAYWLGAQADEIVASPSALVGSVGVYGVHEDWSAANEVRGVKPTYIHAGRFKVEGNPDSPLTEEAAAHIQSLVDATHDLFIRDLASARSVAQKAVREGFGEGRAFHPEGALARGMVDRIDTFDAVLASKPPRMRARRQEAISDQERLALVGQLGELAGAPEGLPDPAEEEAARRAFAFERERRERLGLRPA